MSITTNGYLRVVTYSPEVVVGNISENVSRIRESIDSYRGKTDILVFPELSLTGYTCGDMFLNPDYIEESKKAIKELHDWAVSTKLPLLAIIGAPFCTSRGKLYNCAVVITGDSINPWVIPKKNLPNYSEFYEKRWFDVPTGTEENRSDDGFDLLWTGVFAVNTEATDYNRLVIGVEICEDLWAVNPPSTEMVTRYGADVIINISASPRLIGKESYVKDLVRMTSARLACAYVYCSAGPSESTTDLVFSGYSMIAENGVIISEPSQPLRYSDQIITTQVDIDTDVIRGWRKKNKTITNSMDISYPEAWIDVTSEWGYNGEPDRDYDKYPFRPASQDTYREILITQSLGIQKRMESSHSRKAVIGISGGSDSTLALLALVEAFDSLDRPREDIIGVSMPCFGTSSRTKRNAQDLCEALGITFKEIPIGDTVTSHLGDLGHSLDDYDIAYENAQARLRTVTLFDLSNMENALVIGTGDLSELALGWCTYGADHLSSYNPNVSIPKTLVLEIIRWYSGRSVNQDLKTVLQDICNTPISPELIPGTQLSEDTVGPYDLMDFFLWHFLRAEWRIEKIYRTAVKTFKSDYTPDFIRDRFLVFLKRFQSQQFKRSCLPDGPKVGSVSLSPRGDWRMPSDMSLEVLISKL